MSKIAFVFPGQEVGVKDREHSMLEWEKSYMMR